MKDFSLRAKAYIIAIILIGLGLILWSSLNLNLDELWMTLALSGLASFSLIFKVTGTTERSHYNISFTVFAFSLFVLGIPETIVVILIAHLVEWAWHKYPWYIQSFNIGQYVLVAYLAGTVYAFLNPQLTLMTTQGVISMLVALVAFTFLNHLMVGLVLWFARGENFFDSGVVDPFSLMLDFTLLSMGGGAAIAWTLNPLAVVVILIPLYLVYSTLRVPALERQSETDPKTGLFNARHFHQELDHQLQIAHQENSPLTVVMADLDLLRNINNAYGHLAGDEVLIGVATILKDSVRSGDAAARFGGEEFAILMPGVDPEDIYNRVDEMRKKISETEFVVPSSAMPIRATMSFGIAGRENSDQFANDIIHNADLALHYAKLSGRNRTYLYTGENYESMFSSLGEGAPAVNVFQKSSLEERFPRYGEYETLPSLRKSDFDVLLEAEKDKQSDTKEQHRDLWTNILIGALVAVALIWCAAMVQPIADTNWLALCLFALLVVITEWFSIEIYIRETAVSTSAAPMLAGILLFGPIGALALSLTFAITAKIKHSSHWNRLLFNFGNQLLVAMVYISLINLTGSVYSDWNPLIRFAICLAAAILVYAVTTFALTMVVHLDKGVSIEKFWKEQFSWLGPTYLAIGLIAYVLTLSYQIAGLPGIVAILVPIFILRLSQIKYLEHTKESVKTLRENNLLLEKQKKKISRLNEELLLALSYVIDMRDPYVLGHSNHVVEYAVKIARKLDLPLERIELVRKAGLLHDVGKLGISENILYKAARLTPAETEIIKQHSMIGAEIIGKVGSLQNLVPIVRHHHEHLDGSGYPDGLLGEEIPLEARILGLADAIEAMASDRPYKTARKPDEILEEINRCRGKQFDPLVVDAFIEVIQEESPAIIINSAKDKVESRNSVLAGR